MLSSTTSLVLRFGIPQDFFFFSFSFLLGCMFFLSFYVGGHQDEKAIRWSLLGGLG